MPTIQVGVLPPPHAVSFRDETVRHVSSAGQLPFGHTPDPDVNPRLLSLTWANLNGAAAEAIRRHYDEHPHAVFAITLPRSGEVVRIQFEGPPLIQWANNAFASRVTVEVSEALAFE